MATKIIHKKSSVAGGAPQASDLQPGELAVNLADRIIYSKTTGGDVVEMGVTNATTIIETCKNVSGGSLAKGTPVYQSGTSGNALEVQLADADGVGTMPAIGLLNETLADQAEGELVLMGFVNGIDTSSFTAGDTLYVSTTGTLVNTPPTGEAASIQNIGRVIKVHASNGSILVTGAGRANATPNLDASKIFVGNEFGQAVSVRHSLNALEDVDVDTINPEEAYVLTYNDTDEIWEPRVVPVPTQVALATWTLGSSTATGWAVSEAGGTLAFKFGTTTAMTLDSSGNMIIAGDVYNNSGAIGGTTDPEVGTGEWGYHDSGLNFFFQYQSANLLRLTSTGDLYLVGDIDLDATISGSNSTSYYFSNTSGAQMEIQTNGDVVLTGDLTTN